MKATLFRRSILLLSIVLSASCLLSSLCCAADKEPAATSRGAIPVILDTDIGGDIDDTWRWSCC